MKTKYIGNYQEVMPPSFAEMVVDELNSDKSINTLEFSFEFEKDLGLEGLKTLTQGLKGNNSLKAMKFTHSLSKNDIVDQFIIGLAGMLKVNTALESIGAFLWSKSDNTEMEAAFDQALKVNTTLKKLSLSNLTNALTNGLSVNKGITDLALRLPNDASAEIAQILRSNDTVKTMELAFGGFSLGSAALIAEALKDNKGINSLSLFGGNDELVKQISIVLRSNPNLLSFSILGKVTETAVQEIAKSLIANCALNALSFGKSNQPDNPIPVEGALAIAQSLSTNSNLLSLAFIGSPHDKIQLHLSVIKELAEALKHNSTLRELNISGQKIGYEGMKILSEALGADSSLTLLDVACNNLGNKEGLGLFYLSKVLKSNTKLVNLNLSQNPFEPKDSNYLKEALSINKSLKVINLAGSLYHSQQKEVIIPIIEALKTNNTLTSIDLRNCGADAASTKQLELVLRDNKALKELEFNFTPYTGSNVIDIKNINYPQGDAIRQYLNRNNGLVSDSGEIEQEAGEPEVPSTNSNNPISVQPQHPYNQEESKEGANQNHDQSVWEEKYLKNKAKKLELKEQNKDLQAKFERAQEDKFNMMMTMFNKLNEEKDAQEKKYEEKIERQKAKKQALENKHTDSQQNNMNLLMKMIIDQKTQADKTEDLFREMLGMKDHEIHNLQEVNHHNDIKISSLEEQIKMGGETNSD